MSVFKIKIIFIFLIGGFINIYCYESVQPMVVSITGLALGKIILSFFKSDVSFFERKIYFSFYQ